MDDIVPERNRTSEPLLSAAFEKSWRFVEKDPFLTHNARDVLRARLRAHLERSSRSGEQNPFQLANSAIWNLRNELGRRPGS
ncbi:MULTISPECIES: hypothetical protein [Bradyrhizobium]|uniref:hypothetical protein n=1 Tax=Bradyrhizobium TaxID=374 RepID=UPI0009EEFBC6|nr:MULTISPECIES: hypothetical protein [Bradyrhizobium]